MLKALSTVAAVVVLAFGTASWSAAGVHAASSTGTRSVARATAGSAATPNGFETGLRTTAPMRAQGFLQCLGAIATAAITFVPFARWVRAVGGISRAATAIRVSRDGQIQALIGLPQLADVRVRCFG